MLSIYRLRCVVVGAEFTLRQLLPSGRFGMYKRFDLASLLRKDGPTTKIMVGSSHLLP